ncbi:MAG TPA: glycosyltransferase family 2 protein [Candidatus Fimadaptatus faecigallinarum]|uniref:Glycosyltransferase family 2 protein n=1 Tax=Candidatus Fimadaptatus faecigallinarum TaxID=2840814 RepID=A0A9D1S3R4_9FIRM|nr:glycosyltransferase family 2 protein [Candidatus Fimadaptatus faecigallinarum]
MDKPLVSIIVPVYNAEATLYACVKSICTQSYDNIEIILVNDGSKDDSLNICRAFAALDDRIKIIDKPNSGVSASRNVGIECALGKYVQFVDGDDYLSSEATRLMVERAEQTECDLVIAEFFRVVGRRMTASSNIAGGEVLTQREFVRYLMDSPLNFYYGVMWNKLYRRDIIMQYDIRCCAELNWCEDFLFNMDYYARVNSVAAVDTPIYYYVKRRGSLSNSYISMAPSRVFKMKRTMYAQYKALLEDMELYQQHRAQTRMFFIGYAKDGGVPPFAPIKAEKACQQARRRGEQSRKRLKKYRAEAVRSKVYKPRRDQVRM